MPAKSDPPKDCCPGTEQAVDFPADLRDNAKVFKALGDEVRLKLLYLVREQEVCVCDLVARLGMAQGTLSHHLAVLQQAELVVSRKQGRWNYYQATRLAISRLGVFETACT